jgi:hypothetical protein
MRDRLSYIAVQLANVVLLAFYYARYFITRKRPEQW